MSMRFHSKAGGDILMLDAHAQGLQRILGREPEPRGILEPRDMPNALEALDAAFAADDTARATCADAADGPDAGADEPLADSARDPLPLKRRLWPMRELIRRSLHDQVPIVWGV